MHKQRTLKDFENRPIEEDTIIESTDLISLSGISCLHEEWRWEGVKAESLIFIDEDVSEMNEKELEDFCRKYWDIKSDSQVTIKASSSFTFLNFNFHVPY